MPPPICPAPTTRTCSKRITRQANVRAMPTVRAATSADADAIGRIQVESWRVGVRRPPAAGDDRRLRRGGSSADVARGSRANAPAGSATFVALVADEHVGLRDGRRVRLRGGHGRAVCDLRPSFELGSGRRPCADRARRGFAAGRRVPAALCSGCSGGTSAPSASIAPPAGSTTARRRTSSRERPSSSSGIARALTPRRRRYCPGAPGRSGREPFRKRRSAQNSTSPRMTAPTATLIGPPRGSPPSTTS